MGQVQVRSTFMALSRSQQMSRIRGRDTHPEILLRVALREAGLDCSEQESTPVGRPDLVVNEPPVAIFIDGCFWHGCPEHYVRPRSREDFWAGKLRGNVERDQRQTAALEQLGWRVVRVWEHEVFECPEDVVRRILVATKPRRPPRRRSWRVVEVEVLDKATDLERQYLVDLRNVRLRKTRDRVRSTKKWRRRGVAPRSI